MFKTKNPALLIIDCQKAIDVFSAAERSNPCAEKEIKALLSLWRARSYPVFHIRHASKDIKSPYHASKPTFDFKEEVAPIDQESIVTKSENCAFIDTPMSELLEAMNITELVVCGVLTHHSVDATVRHASALGYRVVVPAECTASFAIKLSNGETVSAGLVQDIFLANLAGEYCEVVQRIE